MTTILGGTTDFGYNKSFYGAPEQVAELVQHLADISPSVGYVLKDAANDHHHYKYASAEAVFQKIRPALADRGIAVMPHACLERMDHYETDKGKKKWLAVVSYRLTFHYKNATLVAECLGSGSDTDDKAVMKANTAALKYVLAGVFLISWGDDPEKDEAAAPSPSPEKKDAIAGAVSALEASESLDQLEVAAKAFGALAGTLRLGKREMRAGREAYAARKKVLDRAEGVV